MSRKLINIEIK